MKIFYFSTCFAPQIGGIEKIGQLLCAEFVAMGHDVQLATLTEGDGEGDGTFPYPITRKPTLRKFFELIRWSDVHVQTNVSLKYALAQAMRPNRFVYVHQNVYQNDDGTRSLLGYLKTIIAQKTFGIANSEYTARNTGAARVVLNAYDDSMFRVVCDWSDRMLDLVFLGRLVTQKGCHTLIDAIIKLRNLGVLPTLTIVGDGPERNSLQRLCNENSLGDRIKFVGALTGHSLVSMLNRHKIIVVPSEYEEPFGIVALEGLACGCVPIVSERGGLVEAIGSHGFTFPNSDSAALAKIIEFALIHQEQALSKVRGSNVHLKSFSRRSVAEQYIAIFQQHVGFL